MDCCKIGRFIYEMRLRNGLTQRELADKLNITDRAVSKWERGLGVPDVSLLNELSLILGVSVSEILDGERNSTESGILSKRVSRLILTLVFLVVMTFFILCLYFVVNFELIFVIFSGLFIGVLLFLTGCKNEKLRVKVSYYSLILYSLLLVISSFYTIFLWGGVSREGVFDANFIPVVGIVDNIRMVMKGIQPFTYLFLYVIVDLCLFVPYSFLVPCFLQERFRLGKYLFWMAVIIIGREVLQGVTGYGVFDINDIILNFIGVLGGYLVNFGLFKVCYRKR